MSNVIMFRHGMAFLVRAASYESLVLHHVSHRRVTLRMRLTTSTSNTIYQRRSIGTVHPKPPLEDPGPLVDGAFCSLDKRFCPH